MDHRNPYQKAKDGETEPQSAEILPSHRLSEVTFEFAPKVGVQWLDFTKIFPDVDNQNYLELLNDIRVNGVLEPIVFLGPYILDGRQRYMAARALCIEYPRAEYLGDDSLGFVISRNLRRRHLSDSQKALIAGKLATLRRGANQHTAIAGSRTQRQVADLFGISVDTVQRGKKVVEKGTLELVAAVQSGEVAISAAAEIASLPVKTQAAALVEGTARAHAKAVRTSRENSQSADPTKLVGLISRGLERLANHLDQLDASGLELFADRNADHLREMLRVLRPAIRHFMSVLQSGGIDKDTTLETRLQPEEMGA